MPGFISILGIVIIGGLTIISCSDTTNILP